MAFARASRAMRSLLTCGVLAASLGLQPAAAEVFNPLLKKDNDASLRRSRAQGVLAPVPGGRRALPRKQAPPDIRKNHGGSE